MLVVVLVALALTILLWGPPHPALNARAPTVPGRRHPRPPAAGVDDPALLVDLTAHLVAGGASIPRSLEHLLAVVPPSLGKPLHTVTAALYAGASWEDAWSPLPRPLPLPLELLERSLRFSATTAAPSAKHLTSEAARIRKQRLNQAQEQVATLGVKLLLPMGLCSLPAFMLWTVIPIVLGLLPL